ncbi:hypothetical protein [Corallococcus sp. AB038B]|uniref:hypothetical protein n=1 Tax=Corallococcus sp. AB038B TaxID=2316718 RepID=UPI000EC44216|nr:hypothetical protein [Corallococcus sp. AB038B]RKH94148.1 hypothetical protein D7Y04_38480 [Corallococcus sp. AB038B]
MPSIPWLRASGLAVAVLCLSACKSGSDTTELRFGINPTTYMRPLTEEASPSRRTAMESPLPPPSFRSNDGLVFTVEVVYSTLFDVRLELPSGRECSDYKDTLAPLMTCTDAADGRPGTLSVREPLFVNWMNAVNLPNGPLRIPEGGYSRIEARLGQIEPELSSFIMDASFTWEGKRHLLAVAFTSTEALRFEPRGPFDIAGSGENTVVVGGLDIATWLEGIPVASCLALGDLTLDNTILRLETGKGACAGAAERVKQNIEASTTMHLASHR